MENKDGGGKCNQSDDNGSCVATSDSGSKLECSTEVIKDDDFNRELESDIPCPQKRRKTAENYDPGETESEGHKSSLTLVITFYD